MAILTLLALALMAGPVEAQARAIGPGPGPQLPPRPPLAAPVAALPGCYADYKAKKDDPLRLHYGVLQLSSAPCTPDLSRTAAATVAKRVAGDGWRLLTVLAIFGPEGLEGRKNSAGTYYLRY